MKVGVVIGVFLMFSTVFGSSGTLKPEEIQWRGRIAGTYSGTLFASGYNMPVETTFYFEGGVLLGEYIMNEEGTLTPGELTDIQFTVDHTVTCTWVDKYGSGMASFTFTGDCSGFAGWWTTDENAESYQWWGSKEDLDMQQVLED